MTASLAKLSLKLPEGKKETTHDEGESDKLTINLLTEDSRMNASIIGENRGEKIGKPPRIYTATVADVKHVMGWEEIREAHPDYPEEKIKDPLRLWILSQLRRQEFSWEEYRDKEQLILHVTDRRFGPTGNKAVLFKGNLENFNPDTATWFGGICLIYTGDCEVLKDPKNPLPFHDLESFQTWFSSWFPRIDQVHDTMGIPPTGCKKAYYVVEDSIWARRIVQWAKSRGIHLDPGELARVLKNCFLLYGKPVIEKWIRKYGYNAGKNAPQDQINIIFSSDIEPELKIALRIYERHRGIIKPADMDDYMVGLMGSTSVLPDIVGAREGGAREAVIAIPMRYLSEMIKRRDMPWTTNGLYHLGYLPYYSETGPTRLQTHDRVVNRRNFRDYWQNGSLDDRGSKWAAANHFFNGDKPFSTAPDRLIQYLTKEALDLYE